MAAGGGLPKPVRRAIRPQQLQVNSYGKVVAIDYTRSLSVGEVAKRSGVAVSTIHFYESKGLIKATRSEGNQRRFSGIVLRYIAIIKVAQHWHTLDEIRAALGELPPDSKLTAAQWKKPVGALAPDAGRTHQAADPPAR